MGNHHFGENLMPDPTDKRIEELWQYIPPYTAPNHPPQVKVITTTNTGDTPMTKNKPVKTDTETITKISDFVWELSTEMDTIREQMEDLQIRMLSIRKMLQIMENPKNK